MRKERFGDTEQAQERNWCENGSRDGTPVTTGQGTQGWQATTRSWESRGRIFPERLQGEPEALLVTWVWNYEGTHFRGLEAPSWWNLVMAAWGISHTGYQTFILHSWLLLRPFAWPPNVGMQRVDGLAPFLSSLVAQLLRSGQSQDSGFKITYVLKSPHCRFKMHLVWPKWNLWSHPEKILKKKACSSLASAISGWAIHPPPLTQLLGSKA